MTGIEYDSRSSRLKRWMIRNGLLVASSFALLISSFLGGALFTRFLEAVEPGYSLLALKLIHSVGGRGWTAALALILLLISLWLRGKVIHLRQKEYDYTGMRVLRDLRANPDAAVPAFYLYLRAFETTGKLHVPLYLRVRRKCIWVAQRLVTDDLESYASLAVGSIAPLIALGKPGEAIGAGRILTDDATWQGDIVTLMKRSTGILLVPSDRPGTVWEMETLRQQGLFSKVIFIMPPLTKGTYDTAERWNAARQAMAAHGLDAPEHQDRGMLFRVGPDGRVANVEPLLLSSPRKIRKSLKRIFKNKPPKKIYKAIVVADKRAGRAAFWGWIENARQLSVFPVAIVAVFMAAPNVGFDPNESWATDFDRSNTAHEISDYIEDLKLMGSVKYQALAATVPPEKRSELNQLLLQSGLPRLADADVLAYFAAQGDMLNRVSDQACAEIASGEIQPAAMQIAQTYIPSERVHDYLSARTAAILAAAEDAPAVPVDKQAEAAAWEHFAANLSPDDTRRYQQLNETQAPPSANDRCWILRKNWKSISSLPAPDATVLARALVTPRTEERSPPAADTTVATVTNPPANVTPAKPPETKRAAVAVQESPKQSTVPLNEPPPRQEIAPAVEAPPPPDPSIAMLEKARAELNTGRLIEPLTDCALYWALQLKQMGNLQGPDLEHSVLLAMEKRIQNSRAVRNYDAAIDDVNILMQFYPGRAQLVSLKSQIENDQQRQATEATLKRFTLQHRHLLVANNGNMVQAYCVGVLLLAPDGTARFDCVNSFDPQGRCDHVEFPGGAIKEVKFLKNGLLHVATNHLGNFDFFGTPTDLQGAYEALGVIASR
jgi:hypothetical protein